MKKQLQSPMKDPLNVIEGILQILKNEPDALRKFMTDILNIDYNFSNKTGSYKILNSEQIQALNRIHKQRKNDKQFDENFQGIVLTASLLVGVGYLITELTDEI